mgnify:CR=1 FL=1
MHTTFGYYDLIEVFSESGCAVCRLVKRDVQRHLDAILYEHVTDPRIHKRFRASRGLCAEHGQMFIQPGGVLGVATLYEAVVDELIKSAQSATDLSPTRGLSRLLGKNSPVSDALSPAQMCIACETEADSEIRYADILGEHIREEKLSSAYRGSEGLCVSHFRQAVTNAKSAENAKLLTAIQVEIWGKLRDELGEFRRKYDFQHVDEAMGAEGDSWLRAVRLVGGE